MTPDYEEILKAQFRPLVAELVEEALRERDQAITVPTAEAAERLGVSVRQVRELVKMGILHPVTWPRKAGDKGGRPRYYFRVEDLRRDAAERLKAHG